MTQLKADAVIYLEALGAFQMIALLQLALRHPKVQGPVAEFGQDAIAKLAIRFVDRPALSKLIERGALPKQEGE